MMKHIGETSIQAMVSLDGALPDPVRDANRLGDRVASGAAMLWLSNMTLRLLQLATTAILAHLLSPSDYGVVALAMTIVGLLDVMSDLQVGSAIMRTVHLTEEHIDTAFTLNLLRGVISAFLLITIAVPAALFLHDARLQNVMLALAASAILASIHNPHFLLFARDLDFRRDAIRKGLAACAGSAVGIVLALITRNYWALVASSLTTSAVTMALSYWRVPGRARLSLRRTSELLSFGSWLLLINIVDYVNSKIDYFLIGERLGSRALGVYHLGQQVTTMATGDVVAPLSSALLPAFSIMSEDPERQRAGYRHMQAITLALALPVGFGTSMLAQNIVLLLVGRQWLMAVPVITFLAPIIALHTMIAGIEALALANNQGRLLFIRTAIFLAVRAGLMVIGFYWGGFMGVIFARVVSGLFFLIYGLGLAAKITNGRAFDPLLASWRSLLSVGVMALALAIFPTLNLLTLGYGLLLLIFVSKVAIGAFIYVGVHVGLWIAAGRPPGPERRLLGQLHRIANGASRRYRSHT